MKIFFSIIFIVLFSNKSFSNCWQINDRGNGGADAICNVKINNNTRWSHLVFDFSTKRQCNAGLAVSLKKQKLLGKYISHILNPNITMRAKINNNTYNLKTKLYAKYRYGFEIGGAINQNLLNSILKGTNITIFANQNNKQIVGINYPLSGAKNVHQKL